MSDEFEYHVVFASGDGGVCQSLRAAQDYVMAETGFDQARPGLLPARIFRVPVGSATGVGEVVETIYR